MGWLLSLGQPAPPPTNDDRTSLIVCIAGKVGALYSALAPLRRYRISLTKIKSRPSKRKAWECFFFADLDGHTDDPRLAKAIAGLEQHCTFVKILGSHPNVQ